MDYKTFKFGSETIYVVKQKDGSPTLNEAQISLSTNRVILFNGFLSSGAPSTTTTDSLKDIKIEDYLSIESLSSW